MRIQGQIRMGYFPLALAEARRIQRFLRWPGAECAVVDPCAGCGTALAGIAPAGAAARYGIELDAYRAEEAGRCIEHVIQGSCFDLHCPVESFSLLYLNPPYDWTESEIRGERTEGVFLEHCYRWLKPGGVLVLVIPCSRLGSCSEILAVHFRDKSVYRLSEPEAMRYEQIAVFGVRRNHRERSQLKDWEVAQARRRLHDMARDRERLPFLPDEADRVYIVPPSGPVNWAYRGIPLDAVEDLLSKSAAYRQASRILFAPETRITGQPLIPLHAGQVGLVAVSGLLDGIFGEGETRHVACWQSAKTVDRFEEVENGVTTIRERERFTQSLTLAFVDGRTAILGDGGKGS